MKLFFEQKCRISCAAIGGGGGVPKLQFRHQVRFTVGHGLNPKLGNITLKRNFVKAKSVNAFKKLTLLKRRLLLFVEKVTTLKWKLNQKFKSINTRKL